MFIQKVRQMIGVEFWITCMYSGLKVRYMIRILTQMARLRKLIGILFWRSGLKNLINKLKRLPISYAPVPQKVHNMKGQVRYLIHLDNPEKYQYSVEEVKSHGGIDVDKYFKATSSQRYEMIREMIDFVNENNILEMKDLIDYASKNRFDDWFPLLCDNSLIIMDAYIRSNRNSQTRKNK